MPISDLFPKAGITFWDCAHEGNGGADLRRLHRARPARSRCCIAQNGPGITNFVTSVKTAYWNHTPMLLVTPQAANKTIGQGGFQEVEQMALFRDMVCYQEEVRDPSRIAEVLNRVIEQGDRAARRRRRSTCRAISGPRSSTSSCRRSSASSARPAAPAAIAEAAKLLSDAKFPVILSGAGVVIGDAIADSVALAERLDAPVCSRLPAQRQLSRQPSAWRWARSATTAPRPRWR